MHDHRSAAASQLLQVLALVAAAALALEIPTGALAQEVANGVESPGAPRIIVVTAAPPPVPGWERPPEIEVVGLDHAGQVVVYSPAPEPMPGWRKLRGVDIRYHRIASAPLRSRATVHSWKPGAPTRIAHHDWRSADRTRIPYARSGSALVAQSWNPYGVRFQASRIRYHGWTRGRGDEL